MEIEKLKIDEVKPDPKNVRRHPARNLEAVKKSLAKFGQQRPILVGEDNVIIAGNCTWQAAKALGWTEIEITRTELKGLDARAYAVADNRTSDLSEFNDEILGILHELQESDFDISQIGFDDGDMAALTAKLDMPDFQPTDGNDQGRLDEKLPIQCPFCKKEFVPR